MDTGEDFNNGCCKDEQKQIKLEKDHQKSVLLFDAMQLLAMALPTYPLQVHVVSFPSVTEENPRSHAPPRSCAIAIYKRNCVFRI